MPRPLVHLEDDAGGNLENGNVPSKVGPPRRGERRRSHGDVPRPAAVPGRRQALRDGRVVRDSIERVSPMRKIHNVKPRRPLAQVELCIVGRVRVVRGPVFPRGDDLDERQAHVGRVDRKLDDVPRGIHFQSRPTLLLRENDDTLFEFSGSESVCRLQNSCLRHPESDSRTVRKSPRPRKTGSPRHPIASLPTDARSSRPATLTLVTKHSDQHAVYSLGHPPLRCVI